MREKIKNPVVVLYKRETSDSYAVSITDGSQNMHDGLLMAAVSPDDSDYPFATFAMVGYYMAAEIEKLRAQRDALAAENVALRSKAAELVKAVRFYEKVKRENPPVETGAWKDAVDWVLKEACQVVNTGIKGD